MWDVEQISQILGKLKNTTEIRQFLRDKVTSELYAEEYYFQIIRHKIDSESMDRKDLF